MAREIRLAEALVRKVGWRAAGRCTGLLVAWALWVDGHRGEAPTMQILAGDNDRSRASYYRDLADFRRAFPDEESPDRLARELLAVAKARRESPERAVFGAPASRFLVSL